MKVFATILTIFLLTQNLLAQNTPPPDMPIPPEFSQPAPPPPQPGNPPQPDPQQMPQPVPPPSVDPNVSAQPANTSRLPDDFELIVIRPYYKNKPRLGKLTATLTSSQGEVLATESGDFGDCKNCIRGASLKGKLGIRLYGSTAKDLTVSRKQSSSIKLVNCGGNKSAFVDNTYTCEFSHKDSTMKLTLKLEP